MVVTGTATLVLVDALGEPGGIDEFGTRRDDTCSRRGASLRVDGLPDELEDVDDHVDAVSVGAGLDDASDLQMMWLSNW